ncbi:MAG: peptide deformylase [Elusimicrobiota bacterium]
MAIRRICKYGEKILQKKTQKVDYAKIKDSLASLLEDMFETMAAVKGAGLAANQIGLDMSLAVIRIEDEKKDIKIVMINPVIVEQEGEMSEDEGCLSFPGLFAKIKRYARVKVRALNEKGLPVEIRGEGLLAKALQHEIDHLNGITFLDHLPLMTRLKLKPVLLKLKRQWKKIDESKTIPRAM